MVAIFLKHVTHNCDNTYKLATCIQPFQGHRLTLSVGLDHQHSHTGQVCVTISSSLCHMCPSFSALALAHNPGCKVALSGTSFKFSARNIRTLGVRPWIGYTMTDRPGNIVRVSALNGDD
jgi:hypothetical protein